MTNAKRSWRLSLAAWTCVGAALQLAAASDREGVPTQSVNESARAQPRRLRIENVGASTAEATISGPQFHAPQSFHSFEEFHSPRIERLRNEYRLDEVVRGETNEFRKILKLRHWVHKRWPIDNDQRFSGDAFAILTKAKSGAGFHCAHSMRVQHAVLTVMGFVVRDLGVDCDHEEFGRSRHHGVNEVWSNEYAKWVLLDAKYDIHFELKGVPLSALELHEAARADGGQDIVEVQGPDRTIVPMNGLEYPTTSPLGYWWVSYHVGLDSFTGGSDDSRLVIFDNAAFRETTWFRGTSQGLKEHWAYDAKAFLPTRDRRQIEWTPGVPELQVRQVSPTKLDVDIRSVTPNLKATLVRTNGGPWKTVAGNRFCWKLGPGKNTLDVRTQNLFEVDGPIVTATAVLEPVAKSE